MYKVVTETKSMKYFPPEVEEGNVEYKLKLKDPTQNRLEHLITQMKWRLKEGEGKAVYKIGVEDNGTVSGLLKEELDSSLAILKEMAKRLEAETSIIRKHDVINTNPQRYAVEVIVNRIPHCQKFTGIRVACLGNVDVGKSTLLGVLCHGELDNGRGRARLNVFRHLHEIQTGRTSSISHKMLGFDAHGNELNNSFLTYEEICASAKTLITFLDLAGHRKYMKTTINGLTCYTPDFVMMAVAANRGIAGTTRDHLGISMALKIPFVIIVTKIDLYTNETIQETVDKLERILRPKKTPLLVENEDDVKEAANFLETKVVPIFKVSSVNGKNLELLRKFYSCLPPMPSESERLTKPALFQIDQIFSVRDVGKVLGGTLRNGTISVGDKLQVGPMSDNTFKHVMVTSIHRNWTPCRSIQAGQTASIALNGSLEYDFRRGQVLLEKEEEEKVSPKSHREFDADLLLLFHMSGIKKNFEATVHIGNIVQTAIIEKVYDRDEIKTGERVTVKLKFKIRPEFIQNGDQFFFREGQCKGIGQVTNLYMLTA